MKACLADKSIWMQVVLEGLNPKNLIEKASKKSPYLRRCPIIRRPSIRKEFPIKSPYPKEVFQGVYLKKKFACTREMTLLSRSWWRSIRATSLTKVCVPTVEIEFRLFPNLESMPYIEIDRKSIRVKSFDKLLNLQSPPKHFRENVPDGCSLWLRRTRLAL